MPIKLLQLQFVLPDGTVVHVDFDNAGVTRGIYGLLAPLTAPQRSLAVLVVAKVLESASTIV